jgi:hypothetical protein
LTSLNSAPDATAFAVSFFAGRITFNGTVSSSPVSHRQDQLDHVRFVAAFDANAFSADWRFDAGARLVTGTHHAAVVASEDSSSLT